MKMFIIFIFLIFFGIVVQLDSYAITNKKIDDIAHEFMKHF